MIRYNLTHSRSHQSVEHSRGEPEGTGKQDERRESGGEKPEQKTEQCGCEKRGTEDVEPAKTIAEETSDDHGRYTAAVHERDDVFAQRGVGMDDRSVGPDVVTWDPKAEIGEPSTYGEGDIPMVRKASKVHERADLDFPARGSAL